MKMSRAWAMPNANTFKVKPIFDFVVRYMEDKQVSVDPFARNSKLAKYTNDLNPETEAHYHMDALAFLQKMYADNVIADLVIFDPPYSPTQVKMSYQGIGIKVGAKDVSAKAWSDWKDAINKICAPDATVISFGWNTVGMGKKRGFEIVEIMMVCHGGQHNDTICMAERKI